LILFSIAERLFLLNSFPALTIIKKVKRNPTPQVQNACILKGRRRREASSQDIFTRAARSRGTSSLLEGCGEDLGRQVEVLAQVLNTGIGQSVVVVLPRELGLDVLLRVQGLKSLDDLQVGDIQLVVLGSIEVLLGNQDAVCSIQS
jgi:hypothetical protein